MKTCTNYEKTCGQCNQLPALDLLAVSTTRSSIGHCSHSSPKCNQCQNSCEHMWLLYRKLMLAYHIRCPRCSWLELPIQQIRQKMPIQRPFAATTKSALLEMGGVPKGRRKKGVFYGQANWAPVNWAPDSWAPDCWAPDSWAPGPRKEGPPTYAILSRNLVLSRFTPFLKGFHRAFNKSHPAFIELSMKAILFS